MSTLVQKAVFKAIPNSILKRQQRERNEAKFLFFYAVILLVSLFLGVK